MPAPKLQRWIDLLAALLRRQYAVTFEEIVAEVPAYQKSPSKVALRRAFERDKDELRSFGVPLVTVMSEGEVSGYRLSARDFYLPYLSVVADGAPSRPRTVDRDGYRALARLAFEPAELEAVADAGRRVEQLGDPLLAAHARSAIRKLAADLPLDVALQDAGASPDVQGADVFEPLSDALARRKRIEFRYRSMAANDESDRVAEPLGLFFVSQHWYLAARDTADGQIKNFRVSRIASASVNSDKPATPDFERPPAFDLREHSRSRQAWELGSGGELEAIVEFVAPGGVVQAAARLGAAVPDHPAQRQFRVRRLDAFVRWLLTLGDAVHPVAPTALLDEYARQVRDTLALYEDPA